MAICGRANIVGHDSGLLCGVKAVYARNPVPGQPKTIAGMLVFTYQSLHTTVVWPGRQAGEIPSASGHMHCRAEFASLHKQYMRTAAGRVLESPDKSDCKRGRNRGAG